MANMSYCRFENTYRDLMDCYHNINNNDLSKGENEYRERMIKICQDILDEYDPNSFVEEEEGEEDKYDLNSF
jgi:hypothetical protein